MSKSQTATRQPVSKTPIEDEIDLVEIVDETDDVSLISDKKSYVNSFGVEFRVTNSDDIYYMNLHARTVKLIKPMEKDGEEYTIERIRPNKLDVLRSLKQL
jgi:hypothetical protein